MSYDAPNARAARNAVPSKEACKKFLRIRKRTVNTVFSAINDNMVEAFDWLHYTFPETEITCGFINVLSEHTPLDLYQFEPSVIKKRLTICGYLLILIVKLHLMQDIGFSQKFCV